MIHQHKFSFFLIIALGLLTFSGCDKNTPETYSAPRDTQLTKEKEAKAWIQSQVNAKDLSLSWQAPSHWHAKPTDAIKKGHYLIEKNGQSATLTITSFPGEAGGITANVNRWRGQVELPHMSDVDLIQTLTLSQIGPFDAFSTPILYTDPKNAILASIIPLPKETWFVKINGGRDIISAELSNYKAFLQTIEVKNRD